MDHGLELIIPILEILEIEVCNILYNPGNIVKRIFNFSYPGNIGNLAFPIFYYPGNIGKLNFCIFYYPGNIWQTDFSHFMEVLKTSFNGGPRIS